MQFPELFVTVVAIEPGSSFYHFANLHVLPLVRPTFPIGLGEFRFSVQNVSYAYSVCRKIRTLVR